MPDPIQCLRNMTKNTKTKNRKKNKQTEYINRNKQKTQTNKPYNGDFLYIRYHSIIYFNQLVSG